MKEKRGFTLIELLAVIVILAVIALIATPIILGIIDDTKKSAFKDSVYSGFDGVGYYLVENNLTQVPHEGIQAGVLKLKGEKLTSGKFIENSSKQLEAVNVSNDSYCANGTKESLEVTKGACTKIIPTMTYNINNENKTLSINIKDTMGIYDYSISETDAYDESGAIRANGDYEINTEIVLDHSTTYYIYVKDTLGEMTALDGIEIPMSMFFTNALSNQTYTIGEIVTWSDLEWYVLNNTDDTATLILKGNYQTGAYGDTTTYKGGTAYNTLNTTFIESNEKIKKSVDEGSLVYNSSIEGYVRLPLYSELSENISNESDTPFWTMTAKDSNIYLGGPNGNKALTYSAKDTATYYAGYNTSVAAITKTGATSVETSELSLVPTQTSITYNIGATEASYAKSYGGVTNHTSVKPQDYPNSYCGSCPGDAARCSGATATYYNESGTTQTFTYYNMANWWNPNYNIWSYTSSCSSQVLYYASGSLGTFYKLEEATYDIGYRPVVTVYKLK